MRPIRVDITWKNSDTHHFLVSNAGNGRDRSTGLDVWYCVLRMGRPLTPLAGSTSQERSDAWSNVARRGRAPSLSANPFFVQLFVEANVFQLIKLRTNLCELAGNVGLGGPFACGHRFSRAQRRCPTYYDLARLYNTVPEKAMCMIASAGERSMRIY